MGSTKINYRNILIQYIAYVKWLDTRFCVEGISVTVWIDWEPIYLIHIIKLSPFRIGHLFVLFILFA